mgnify:CR=1 FL=1
MRTFTAAVIAPNLKRSAGERLLKQLEIPSGERGWIRALRGNQTDLSGVAFKSDDGPKFSFPAETTSKVLLFATNGRFYTLEASKLPGGRGHGEPVRLFCDIEQDGDTVSIKTDQGEMTVASAQDGGSVALPAGFPDDVFLPSATAVLGPSGTAGRAARVRGARAIAEREATVKRTKTAFVDG